MIGAVHSQALFCLHGQFVMTSYYQTFPSFPIVSSKNIMYCTDGLYLTYLQYDKLGWLSESADENAEHRIGMNYF